MTVRIRISSTMSAPETPLGTDEDRYIRLPREMREELRIKPGQFLSLEGINGSVVNLQVHRSYLEDAFEDVEAAYVSRFTYQHLNVRKISAVKPHEDILLGCDPEFFIVNRRNGSAISASHFFPHNGEVGSDCGLAELRPRPAYTEKELVSNINHLLKQANHRIQDRHMWRQEPIEMVAASNWNKASAGFHVHYGMPVNFLDVTYPNSRINLARMVNVLDYYVGIPSILPEGEDDAERRSGWRNRYGKPGDYRADLLTLEYRVPGGHLLRHPDLSSGLISISKVVMKDMLSRFVAYARRHEEGVDLRDYNKLKEIYPNLPPREEVFKAITDNKSVTALRHTDKILNDLQKMVGFEDEAKPIINYFDYVISNISGDKKYSESLDLNWRLN